MKHIIFTIIFTILLIFVLPFVLLIFVEHIPGDFQPPLKDTKKIYGEYQYSQDFISQKDNLSGIGVSLKNPQLVNKSYTYFKLYDDQNNLIRQVDLKGENIADGKFVKILFDPVVGSQSKKFTWSVSSPESTEKNGLEVFLTDRKPSWSMEFRVNSDVTQDSLSYVPLHKVTNSAEVIRQVVTDWISKLTADKGFFVVYLGLLISLIISIILFPKFLPRNLKRLS